jgi:predicted PurR-regulated permease PerM
MKVFEALPPASHRLFVERLLIAIALLAAVLTLWWLRDLLLLLFGALVTATLLLVVAEPISRRAGLGPRASLAVAILGLLLAAGLPAFFFGSLIDAQFADLARSIPTGWEDLRRFAAQYGPGRELIATLDSGALNNSTIVGRLGDLLLTLGNALLDFILIGVGAVFFAAQPRLYHQGFLKLFPADWRGPLDAALEDSGHALRLWFRGQLLSMAIVGALTWLGLVMAGVPAALALAMVAAALEVIPYVGPILAAIPGLLLAIAVGPETALWALLVYVFVQQVEGNVIQPLVQRKVVTLPPAVTLFGMVAAGLLFGFLGIVFAAPGAVVAYVLLKRLYVRELLHAETSVPGEAAGTEKPSFSAAAAAATPERSP